ncbi:ABC transporter permease [Paenibacillus donghaensis]|uniref:ABC3 transporter permease C-terminal domain-containing protein n=1 Tax=Paenibacillus donghaensis TaxID=414771 RepID=A0A2Z2KSH1_9BACL|nr:FtsX-like permease family protein [Paenibacillus donghaensis]ASA25859.1 hypothetical protein B9T62_37115 [Paenibacillus donghaensis]
MRHYRGVSLRFLKRQRLLTVLTVIAIALSVALVSVLAILSDALKQSQIIQAETLLGQQHVHFKGLTPEQLETLRADGRIQRMGFSKVVGSTDIPDENFPINLEEQNIDAIELLGFQLLQGRYPTAANEIMLDEQSLGYLGVSFTEDTQITLPVAINLMQEDGSFTPAGIEEKLFTLTGVAKNHPATVGGRYGVGCVGPGSFPELPSRVGAFVRFTSGVDPVQAEEDLAAKLHLAEWQVDENSRLLSALGYEGRESEASGIGGLGFSGIIVGGLILLAACLVIYNIFQVSVVQRTRQFGTLRAIGATPAQIRKLVVLEALLLCAFGIPLGLLLGILSSRGVVSSVGSLINPEVLGVSSLDEAVEVVRGSVRIPWRQLAGAAGLGLAATLLSAWLPARMASRVPPVTAITGLVGSGVTRTRPSRRRRPARHILWQTARLNLSRNRGRTAVTVISLTMMVITYVTLQSFLQSFNMTEILADSMDSAYSLTTLEGLTDQDLAAVRAMPGVERVRTAMEAAQPYDIDAHKAAELQTDEASQAYSVEHTFEAIGYDDATLQLMLDEVGSSAPTLQQMREQPLALVWDKEVNYRFSPQWAPPAIGESLPFLEHSFQIAGTVDNIAIHRYATQLGYTLLMHEDQLRKLLPAAAVNYADIFLNPSITSEQDQKIHQMLEQIASNTAGCTLSTFEDTKADLEKSLNAIKGLGYGMILLVSLIGSLNIINTTVTSLHARRSELGTLRAIGMSSAQLNGMVILESLQYGLRALLFGLPLGMICSALVMSSNDQVESWQPPIGPLFMASLFALLLCLLAAWPPVASMKKMNIVESIGRVD